MTDTVTIALITNLGLVFAASIAAAPGIVAIWGNRRISKRIENNHAENAGNWDHIKTAVTQVATETQTVKVAVENVIQQTNGRLDKLLATTAESERAKGNLEGRAALKAEGIPVFFTDENGQRRSGTWKTPDTP